MAIHADTYRVQAVHFLNCEQICNLNQNQSMQGDGGMPISAPQLQRELAHLK